MRGKPKKTPREKDLTQRFLSGRLDGDRIDPVQRFTARAKYHQINKTLRTALMRAEEQADLSNLESLPTGIVVQVFSLFCDVEHQSTLWRCVVRKTLMKIAGGEVVVGDLVRFRDLGIKDEAGQPQAVIEQVLPRDTVLTRADSFRAIRSHPIVANAEHMLIVASLHQPDVKWGLIDRMIVAARSGGLKPIVCLNKIDLAHDPAGDDLVFAQQALVHYEALGIRTLKTSVPQCVGIDMLREILRDRTTALAGHSGVGKSSLIRVIEPQLDIRIGAISGYSGKGRHVTSSARRYALTMGGYIVDTPGVKLFGLWAVTRDNLMEYFPDVEEGSAPEWRVRSCRRIAASLPL